MIRKIEVQGTIKTERIEINTFRDFCEFMAGFTLIVFGILICIFLFVSLGVGMAEVTCFLGDLDSELKRINYFR